MEKYRSESTKRLFETILNLETIEDCYEFFEDLCTVKEMLDMAQRFDTAILLSQGKNYHEISDTVGISTATISRVSRCLNYGSGGYQKAIDNLKVSKGDN